jgi:hypothetical protein
MGYFLEGPSSPSQGFNITFSQGLGLRSFQGVNLHSAFQPLGLGLGLNVNTNLSALNVE